MIYITAAYKHLSSLCASKMLVNPFGADTLSREIPQSAFALLTQTGVMEKSTPSGLIQIVYAAFLLSHTAFVIPHSLRLIGKPSNLINMLEMCRSHHRNRIHAIYERSNILD